MAKILTIRPEHTHEDGLEICDEATQKLGFYGATPIAQQKGASQAKVATATIENAAGDAPTAAEYNAVVARANALTTLVNELRDNLVSVGLIKGSA